MNYSAALPVQYIKVQSGSFQCMVITGFQFMANKQFRMKKILGTSVCADISQHALKNQYIQDLYDKITQQVVFLDDNFVFL